MHFRIGLTGGVASGKSTVSHLFAELGVTIIDADLIARQLLEKNTDCFKQVVQLFGDKVLLDNGEINRPFLRELIFTDAAAKQAVEQIIHPNVRKQMLATAAISETPYCILVVPLLIEADMLALVDRTLVVDIPEPLQLQRLCQRDSLTEQQARRILDNQAPRDERLRAADDVIDNQGDTGTLQKKVKQLHFFYRDLAEKYNASC